MYRKIKHTGYFPDKIVFSLPKYPFDFIYLTYLLKEYRNPRNKIGLMLKKGQIIRVKKGIYVLSPDYGGKISKLSLAKLPKNKALKVRFELDIDPPGKASYEVKTLLIPFPFQVRIFALPDLFAGKVHAVLCRKWQQRIKGRDLYDMIWYIGKGIECNVQHLQARMEQTGDWQGNEYMEGQDVREKLHRRFSEINFDSAKKDILPFINDPAEVQLWSKDFFIQRIPEIRLSGD